MKKAELLKTEHSVQLKWLKNQIAKIANEGKEAFKNPNVAERAFQKLEKNNLIISDPDIEHFIGTYLSEAGTKKLVTTLRVYLKRNNTERLQVEITHSNKTKLDKLVKMSGMTKIEIINKLIEDTNFGEFKRPEEQLEIVTM